MEHRRGLLAAMTPWIWPALPVVVAVVIGVIVHAGHPITAPTADAATYTCAGHGLAGVPWQVDLCTPEWGLGAASMRGFTYPALIASVLTLGGSDATVGWLQGLIILPATVFVLFLAGSVAFSRRVGLLASWTYALWLPAAIYTGYLMQETLLAFLMAVLLWLLAHVARDRSWTWAGAAGLLLGLMAITHSAFQVVGVVVILAVLFGYGLRSRQARTAAIAVALGLVLVTVPVQVFRSVNDLPGQGQGSRGYGAGGGWTFWAGSNADTGFHGNPDLAELANLTKPESVREAALKVRDGAITTDRHMQELLARKLSEQPTSLISDGDYYALGLANLRDHWTQVPAKVAFGLDVLTRIPPNMQLYGEPVVDWSGPWKAATRILAVGALIGAVFVVWRRRSQTLLLVPISVQLFVLVMALPETRHHLPLVGTATLLAAFAIGQLLTLTRSDPLRVRTAPG